MKLRSTIRYKVWRHSRTGTVHRDPHCTRIRMSEGAARVAGLDSPFEVEIIQGGAAFALGKHCAYCYSRAGYHRVGDERA